MNKYLLLGTIAGFSLFVIIFATWAKSTHQAYTDKALQVGKICQIVGSVALFLLLFVWLKKKK